MIFFASFFNFSVQMSDDKDNPRSPDLPDLARDRKYGGGEENQPNGDHHTSLPHVTV